MSKSLLSIFWKVEFKNEEDLAASEMQIFFEKNTPVIIDIKSCDLFFDQYLDDVGYDEVINSEALAFIIPHIQNHLIPDIKKLTFSEMLRSTPCDYGNLILVFEVNSFETKNHPEDPVEYDLTVECLGILDDQLEIVNKKLAS
jgi:hypothetical protein